MQLRLHDYAIILGAALLSVVPLLWPSLPPLVDLPGHLGSFRIALDINHSSNLMRYYTYHWHVIANLGVDILVDVFGPLLGLEFATKLITMTIPLLTTAGFLLASKEVHGRLPITSFLALPLSYCYPLHYGFVNYCLAMGIASVAFALWLKLRDRRQFLLRSFLFFIIAPIVWVAHAIGWLLLGALCAGAELRLNRDRGLTWPKAVWTTIAACLPLAGPIILQILISSHQPVAISGIFEVSSLIKWAITLCRDRWMVFDIFSAIFLYGVIILTAIKFYGLRFNPVLLWPAIALAVLFLVVPQAINGSFFVNGRIVPYAVAYVLLAIDPSQVPEGRRRFITSIALLFFAIRLAGTTISLALYDRSYRQTLAALEYIRPGSAVAIFARQSCTPGLAGWANTRLQHIGDLALVRRDAFVNDLFTADSLQLAGTRYQPASAFLASGSNIVTLEPCNRNGTRFLPDALQALPHAAFQYVWLLDVPIASRPRVPWLNLLQATPQTALYSVNK